EQADHDLGAVIRAAPDSDAAAMAGGLLAAAHARNGRMRQALGDLDHAASQTPTPEWKDSRERLEVLARYPGQAVAAGRYSRLRYTRKHDLLEVRFEVNGKPADFGLDTGASLSVISESRARALGISIHDATFGMSDIAGKKLPCRAGTAGELAAGKYRLRNVPFCVLPDNQPGFVADPESSPAFLGLPVIVAFGSVRWDTDGNFEIGVPSKRPNLRDSNICFDGSSLLVEAAVGRRKLSFILDTGNPTTMLFSSFADEIAALRPGTRRAKHEFQGLGEPAEVEATELRDLRFHIAGKDLALAS